MLQLAPLPQKVLDPEKIDLFYPWPEKVWLRANMVQSLDSVIVDQNGTTKNLSGEIDKKVFRTLRQLCDVVIIGSNTAQKSPYQDFKISEKHQIIRKRLRMPEKPRLAIISNNLNITFLGVIFVSSKSSLFTPSKISSPSSILPPNNDQELANDTPLDLCPNKKLFELMSINKTPPYNFLFIITKNSRIDRTSRFTSINNF